MPQRRFNSIERIERPLIFGTEIEPSRRSTTRQGMPAMPSSIASASPTGPPPAIKTGIGSPLIERTVRWASAPVNDGHRPIVFSHAVPDCFWLGKPEQSVFGRTQISGEDGMADLRDKFAA